MYKDLGRPTLKKALEGFNGTIFAYGQTVWRERECWRVPVVARARRAVQGSGKSFSMMGYGEDHGIIPKMNGEMFDLVSWTMRGGVAMATVRVYRSTTRRPPSNTS